MGRRERLAALLHDAGALRAFMFVRRLAPIPSTISILTYHHIAEDDPHYRFDPGVADATPSQFRRQMELCARYANPIGIDELVRALDGAPLPKNPVMVTFDDGYRSCHDTALEILQQVGMPAVFFIATSFINDRRLYWWERIAYMLSAARIAVATIDYPKRIEVAPRDPDALHMLAAVVKDTPALDLERFLEDLRAALHVDWNRELERKHADELVMTWDHVRALAKAGMDVESHTRNHRVLQTLEPSALRDELEGSRLDLEREIGRPVRAIAYPVGRKISHLVAIRDAVAAAGYRVGFTNGSGARRIWPQGWSRVMPTDRFDVPRLSTDRDMSDAMYFTQIAVPSLAYLNNHH